MIIDTPSVGGSIDLKGGKIDDIVLKDYHETIDPKSPNVRLFSPPGAPDAYWAETGFVSPAGAKTPGLDTVWTADRQTLTPTQPVTLTWDNGAGLVFKRVIAVDDKYMFTITDSVVNSGGAPATVQPYGLILRHGRPNVAGYSVLHEGFVGVIGDGGVAASHLREHREGDRQGQRLQGRRRLARLHRQVLGLRGHSRADRADRGAVLGQRDRSAGRLPGRFPRQGADGRAGRVRSRPRPASSPARKRCRRSTITTPSSASRSSI